MSTLLYTLGQETGAPADPLIVRSTTAIVRDDAPPAEADGPPEFEGVVTDGNPELGMVNRQVASDWHEAIKGTNAVAADASAEHNAIVDRQVASAGRAPNLEVSEAVFGHGSVSWAYGIEPVLRDGAAFGSDYFAANPTGSQEGIPQVMTLPPGYDQTVNSDMSAAGKERARDANQASNLYAAYYHAVVG